MKTEQIAEDLRKSYDEARQLKAFSGAFVAELIERISAAEAERDRLREALTKLQSTIQYWAENPRPDEWILQEWVRNIDAALDAGKEQGNG